MKTAAAPRKRRPAAKEEAHVSQALRTVYQRAVEEDIPSEMLDLLSRLD
ncbi:MAG: NepR family anti-sigma factor [Pseudomonadota bacterium]|nr:NepR family anti-sigma factor [Sphingobium sp. KCTC 72723]